MKKHFIKKYRNVFLVFGWLLGLAALGLAIKNIHWSDFFENLFQMNFLWLIPIISLNFVVFAFKAMRWQIMISPIKSVPFPVMYKTVLSGYMANNILPTRLGEVAMVYYLGKQISISKIRVMGSLIAERIIDYLSFLLLGTSLLFLSDLPDWVEFGVKIVWGIVLTLIIAVMVSLKLKVKREESFLHKLQHGTQSLKSIPLFLKAFVVSLFNWASQVLMLFLIHVAFGVDLPIWTVILVLVAVNVAISVPTTPAQVGVFEYVCMLCYRFAGLDDNMGLVLGMMYHLLQVIPNLVIGSLFFVPIKKMMSDRVAFEKQD